MEQRQIVAFLISRLRPPVSHREARLRFADRVTRGGEGLRVALDFDVVNARGGDRGQLVHP